MKQLKLEYIETLPEKRDRVATLFKNQQLDELETEFHKMKGTGKTYGLGEVSQLGEVLEKICMKKPSLLGEAVPVACELLDLIFHSRKKDEAFSIEEADAFQILKAKVRK